MNKPKIKILYDSVFRNEILELIKNASQIQLANWAMNCAKHILNLSPEKINLNIINLGFQTNKLWQEQYTTVHEIRQIGFKIHEEARKTKNEISKNILRTVGHAVAVGHMKEHAIVCSDYAIKTVQLSSVNNLKKITEERKWQQNELIKIIKS